MTQEITPVAIGGGYPLDRAGLRALVASLPGLHEVPLDAHPPPRVLVWDAGPGDLTGLPGLEPGTAFLLLITGDECPDLPSGVAGLFSKSETPEALAAAIRQVARGQQYLSPSLALALLQRRKAQASPPQVELSVLTERECQVLALLAQGLSNKVIAARLYLSVRTVEGHLAELYVRLGAHSRTEAALIAIQHNLSS